MRRLVFATTLLTAAGCFGGATATAIGASTAEPSLTPFTATHPVCSQLASPPASQAAASSSLLPGRSSTFIAIAAVPPVVQMVLDPQGHPYAIATNTGKAPSCDDQFVAFSSRFDTEGHMASLALVNEVMSGNLSGTWRPGQWRSISWASVPNSS